MKKIMFITPPYHCGVVEVAGSWLPPHFVYLAAAARIANVEAVIYDAMGLWKSHDDIIAAVERERPDYVATSSITATTPEALTLLENVKALDPSIITMIGGVHASFMDKELLRENPETIDFIIRGEGEETLRELLTCLEAQGDPFKVRGVSFSREGDIIKSPPRTFAKNLDAFGRAWDLIDWPQYTYYVYPGSRLGIINTSRGCDNICTFCSQQKFWNHSWRGRSPGSVLSEIEMIHEKYGVDTILLGDEYPTCDRERWEAILDGLIDRRLPIRFLMETRVEDIPRDEDIMHKYRKAGIVHVYVGVEATNQETLDLIKKDLQVDLSKKAIDLLKNNGMITETSFILGFPHETPETAKRTLELSQWYNPDFAHYLAITPWPYADMYKDVKGSIVNHDYAKYNLIDPVIKPDQMAIEEIDLAMVESYRDFYMGKMKELIKMEDAERKDYLLRSMKLIMGSSFITKKLGGLSGIPKHCLQAMKNIGKEVTAP